MLEPSFVKLVDDRDVLNLLVGKFAVSAVNLREDVASIYKKDAVVNLGFVKEPQRCRKRYGIEYIGWQR